VPVAEAVSSAGTNTRATGAPPRVAQVSHTLDGVRSGSMQEPNRDEDERERVNRELIELLTELRVALPGVQVLFAFLLTLPFTQGFSKVTAAQRAVYFGSFVCAAVATALLIAPTSYHRLNFRKRNKERLLLTANKLSVAGLAFLAVAISGVVYLISDVLYHVAVAAVATAVLAGWFAWFWYALPLLRRVQNPEERRPP
jgi:hypothetical protein